MSASLVGSEMCIRDRQCVATIPLWTSPACGGSAVHTTCIYGTCGSLPVSYTHLTLPTICSV
eukprot:1104834-Alexandrium_andersonii.AAC.1